MNLSAIRFCIGLGFYCDLLHNVCLGGSLSGHVERLMSAVLYFHASRSREEHKRDVGVINYSSTDAMLVSL